MAEKKPFEADVSPDTGNQFFGQLGTGDAKFKLVVSKKLRRNPGSNDLGELEALVSVVAGVKKLHIKIDGVIVSTLLT